VIATFTWHKACGKEHYILSDTACVCVLFPLTTHFNALDGSSTVHENSGIQPSHHTAQQLR